MSVGRARPSRRMPRVIPYRATEAVETVDGRKSSVFCGRGQD